MPNPDPLNQPPEFDPTDPRWAPQVPSPYPGYIPPAAPDNPYGPPGGQEGTLGPIPPEDVQPGERSLEDEIVDVGRDTGVVMPGSPNPVPLPDPGSIDWDDYGVVRIPPERIPGNPYSGQPVLVNKRTKKRIGVIIPHAFGPPRMNILAGESAGQRIGTPFPNEPNMSPPADEFRVERKIPTRIERSDDYYRRQAERALEDTAKRLAKKVIEGVAERVGVPGIGRVLGPIGAGIGAIITPGELGSGEAIPGLELPLPSSPDIPAPVITQPEPLPLPAPSTVDIPMPLPAPSPPAQPSTSGAPKPAAPGSVGSPAPRPGSARTPAPRTASAVRQVPWWTLLSRTISNRSRQPWQTAIPTGQTSLPSPSASLQPPSPAPATSATPAPSSPTSPFPLTSVQPSVSQSAPPRVRTPTRQRECHCRDKPKKRKKPRECIARGQLQWVSGPKKGKPAGSRCVNFKGR